LPLPPRFHVDPPAFTPSDSEVSELAAHLLFVHSERLTRLSRHASFHAKVTASDLAVLLPVFDLSRGSRVHEGEEVAMNRVQIQPVDGVEITVLMDNATDPLLVDQEAVARINWPKALAGGLPTSSARVSPDSGVPDALIAEPGFSALVRIERDGRQRTLLFDTGVSPSGMVENMRRLGIAPAEVEVIVLSHGHWDHVTGMEGLVRELGRTQLPVMIHPEFWNRRRVRFPGLEPAELPATSRSALEEMGFTIVEERQPSFLLDGAVLITGEVDRTTEFETGFQGHEALRDGEWRADPLILDDQALIVSLGDRGLVILSGCGHAGIVNTVRFARKLTGNDAVAAIIGGFHLSGPMFERIIEPTVDALAELSPSLLVPAHCTGWRAVHRLATRFPDAFVMSTVGTTISL
jgi:7,8-dihydropterin-6-yl-methyl-4-(beta-D-ribofuranosyl)aminobenzene 5'-phosphate synthase